MNCIVIFLLLPLLLDKFHICKEPRKVNKDEDEDVKQLAEENFASVKMQQWVAVCRHVKAVEEKCTSWEHKTDRVMDRIISNADEDDENTLESSISCYKDDDIQRVGLLSSDE